MVSMKKVLLGACGAAAITVGAVSSAQAHTVVGTATNCDLYAREYAQVYSARFGIFGGWQRAYDYAYRSCLTGAPAAVATTPTVAGLVTAPVAAAANVATGAAMAAGTIAGTALSIPGTVLGALASPFAAPAVQAPAVQVEPAAAEPVVRTNYRGSFTGTDLGLIGAEPTQAAALAPVTTTTVVEAPAETTAAVALTAAPVQGTPEWYAYCAAKYRSFDPATGTYLAYSGVRRMCR